MRICAALITCCAVAFPVAADVTLRDGYVAPVALGDATDLYLVLDNLGQYPDYLRGATSPFATEIILVDASEAGVLIPEKARADVVPGASGHLRLLGATAALVDGEEILLTLDFARQGKRLFSLPVDKDRTPIPPGPRR